MCHWFYLSFTVFHISSSSRIHSIYIWVVILQLTPPLQSSQCSVWILSASWEQRNSLYKTYLYMSSVHPPLASTKIPLKQSKGTGTRKIVKSTKMPTIGLNSILLFSWKWYLILRRNLILSLLWSVFHHYNSQR